MLNLVVCKVTARLQKVKNEWGYISAPSTRIHGVDGDTLPIPYPDNKYHAFCGDKNFILTQIFDNNLLFPPSALKMETARSSETPVPI
jgi:hypothetical protein